MLDLLMIVFALAGFGLCALLVVACDKLREPHA